MGHSLTASCDCGYESESMLFGYGMRPASVFIPYLCRACHEVFSGNPSTGKPVPCPSCNKPSRTHVPWKNRGSQMRWRMGKIHLTCPKCFRKTLRFQESGGLIWD